MEIEINRKFQTAASDAARPSDRVLAVAEMFGIGLDERHEITLYELFDLRIRRGDIVYVTGPSGCGKTVLLRAIVDEMRKQFAAHTDRMALLPGLARTGGLRAGGLAGLGDQDPEGPLAELGEVDLGGPEPIIDRFDVSLDQTLHLASVAGLSDAFLLLRRPDQLSDGQQYRYRLAQLLASGARTIVIDEFCSTLDRRTAKALAYRIRKYADRTGTTFIVATAHDDLAEDLVPDVLVRKLAGRQVELRSVALTSETSSAQ